MKNHLNKIFGAFIFAALLSLNINTTDSLNLNVEEVNANSLNESPCWGAGEIGTGRYVECPTCVRVLHYKPLGPAGTCSTTSNPGEN